MVFCTSKSCILLSLAAAAPSSPKSNHAGRLTANGDFRYIFFRILYIHSQEQPNSRLRDDPMATPS